ncbi:GNAT family N-acetyltransferase [Blastococcus sp. SYSU DS1024]
MTWDPRPRPEAHREPASGEWAGVPSLTTETLRTERLVLRPFRTGDADAVHRASQDPETQRW